MHPRQKGAVSRVEGRDCAEEGRGGCVDAAEVGCDCAHYGSFYVKECNMKILVQKSGDDTMFQLDDDVVLSFEPMRDACVFFIEMEFDAPRH